MFDAIREAGFIWSFNFEGCQNVFANPPTPEIDDKIQLQFGILASNKLRNINTVHCGLTNSLFVELIDVIGNSKELKTLAVDGKNIDEKNYFMLLENVFASKLTKLTLKDFTFSSKQQIELFLDKLAEKLQTKHLEISFENILVTENDTFLDATKRISLLFDMHVFNTCSNAKLWSQCDKAKQVINDIAALGLTSELTSKLTNKLNKLTDVKNKFLSELSYLITDKNELNYIFTSLLDQSCTWLHKDRWGRNLTVEKEYIRISIANKILGLNITELPIVISGLVHSIIKKLNEDTLDLMDNFLINLAINNTVTNLDIVLNFFIPNPQYAIKQEMVFTNLKNTLRKTEHLSVISFKIENFDVELAKLISLVPNIQASTINLIYDYKQNVNFEVLDHLTHAIAQNNKIEQYNFIQFLYKKKNITTILNQDIACHRLIITIKNNQDISKVDIQNYICDLQTVRNARRELYLTVDHYDELVLLLNAKYPDRKPIQDYLKNYNLIKKKEDKPVELTNKDKIEAIIQKYFPVKRKDNADIVQYNIEQNKNEISIIFSGIRNEPLVNLKNILTALKKNNGIKILFDNSAKTLKIIAKETLLFDFLKISSLQTALETYKNNLANPSIKAKANKPAHEPQHRTTIAPQQNFKDLTDNKVAQDAWIEELKRPFCRSKAIEVKWNDVQKCFLITIANTNDTWIIDGYKKGEYKLPMTLELLQNQFIQRLEKFFTNEPYNKMAVVRYEANANPSLVKVRVLENTPPLLVSLHEATFNQIEDRATKVPKIVTNSTADDANKYNKNKTLHIPVMIAAEEVKSFFINVLRFLMPQLKEDYPFKFLPPFTKAKNKAVYRTSFFISAVETIAATGQHVEPIIFFNNIRLVLEEVEPGWFNVHEAPDKSAITLVIDLRKADFMAIQDKISTGKYKIKFDITTDSKDAEYPILMKEEDPNLAEDPIKISDPQINKIRYTIYTIKSNTNLQAHFDYHLQQLTQNIPAPNNVDSIHEVVHYLNYIFHALHIFRLLNSFEPDESKRIFNDWRNLLRHCFLKLSWHDFYHKFQPLIRELAAINQSFLIKNHCYFFKSNRDFTKVFQQLVSGLQAFADDLKERTLGKAERELSAFLLAQLEAIEQYYPENDKKAIALMQLAALIGTDKLSPYKKYRKLNIELGHFEMENTDPATINKVLFSFYEKEPKHKPTPLEICTGAPSNKLS